MNAKLLGMTGTELTYYSSEPEKAILHLMHYGNSTLIMEPGKELPWSSAMYSPWCVNTDKYTLTFITSDTLQSPHLVYAPSYLTAYK